MTDFSSPWEGMAPTHIEVEEELTMTGFSSAWEGMAPTHIEVEEELAMTGFFSLGGCGTHTLR